MPPRQVPAPKIKQNPGKRSQPAQTQSIINDMRKRLPPDSEDQGSINRRADRSPPPRQKGARVGGRRKDNPPV